MRILEVRLEKFIGNRSRFFGIIKVVKKARSYLCSLIIFVVTG
jgi:hypothetical protein